MRTSLLEAASLLTLAGTLCSGSGCAPGPQPDSLAPAALEPAPPAPRFFHAPALILRQPDRRELVNRDGSPRVARDVDYARFWEEVAPRLEEWATDPRLGINPAYVAALIAKESGFEQFATSWTPANGYPQLTHPADQDMREIAASASEWRWMLAELKAWPRHPLVHRADASKPVTDSLVAAGEITPDNEYFFDPVASTRGAVFWLRLLAESWLADEWPGRYGRFARDRLNQGAPLSEDQLLDLVTVSYNQGYRYVHDLLERHGTGWLDHLNEEAADHLERIRFYSTLFQGGEPVSLTEPDPHRAAGFQLRHGDPPLGAVGQVHQESAA